MLETIAVGIMLFVSTNITSIGRRAMQIWTRRVRTRLLATTMRRLSTRLLPWVLIGLGLWILRDAIGLIWPGTALRLVHPSAYCTVALPFGPITTRPDGLVTGNAFGQYLGCDAIVQF